VRRVAEWAAVPRPADVDPGAGREAARRALHVEGDVALDGPSEVVELAAEANIAAGRHAHSLADVLPSTAGGKLVLVVRDAHRHPSMREAVEAHPGAIVVETGIPDWRPAAARGFVATYGGSRASLEAVADLLRAQVPA
jgi:beta-N-acetylhexosaminidase